MAPTEPPPLNAKIAVVVVAVLHCLVGVAVFAGLYIVVLIDDCLYDISGQSYARFLKTGEVCDAPIWVSALVKSDASWGATMAGAAVVLCIVHDRLIYWIATACAVLYTLGSLVLTVTYAALGILAFPWVVAPAAFTVFGVCEAYAAYRAATSLELLARTAQPEGDGEDPHRASSAGSPVEEP
eukprot:CAMPEP_0174845516 /NCGR_PEP_ID=MMETSP1114-20130205/11776_1 /TAXON_ID=312471 /ORGANISM="Neobodo designis, Strain CCAP 1951/1" /LENGTH=182 /DNA_ID=CAMNT_0016079763 /DNA_START=90 /DNA_END=634 /DNA_ORIENTATION=+